MQSPQPRVVQPPKSRRPRPSSRTFRTFYVATARKARRYRLSILGRQR